MVCPGRVRLSSNRNVSVIGGFATVARVAYKGQLSYPDLPRPRYYPIEDPKNSGGGDVGAADYDPTLSQAQPVEDRVSNSTDDVYVYSDGFTIPQCPDNNVGSNTANVDKTPYDGSSGSDSPCATIDCTNPSLEDGDGICTCYKVGGPASYTITITPPGGPGNVCPTTTCSTTATATGGSKAHLPSNRPLRVMIVGDSISHGEEGDWTWRYRLWQWFKGSTSTSVDFVG